MAVRVTFSSITLMRYHAVRARIRAQSEKTDCVGNTGTATGDKITIAWTYDEGAQKLAFTCTERPWWKSEGFVSSKILSLMEAL
jgi:hypothetical protein